MAAPNGMTNIRGVRKDMDAGGICCGDRYADSCLGVCCRVPKSPSPASSCVHYSQPGCGWDYRLDVSRL